MALYDFDKMIGQEFQRLEKSEICSENKQLIKRFYTKLLAEGLSKSRIYKYMVTMRVIAKKHDKPFESWQEDDIIDFLAFLETNGYKRETINDYKKALKKFFTWLKGKDWKVLENIKTKKDRNKKPDFLTEDEIMKMIEVVDHPRDKALIAVGYEGGLRIGELAGIKIQDVEFLSVAGNLKAKIKVNGKTGERRLPLIMSILYLKEWLEVHPDRDNPQAFVFCSISNRKLGQPMEYQSFSKIIKTAAKKAGIKKRVHLHILRHSRATKLAQYLTESVLCEYFGWVQGSDVPRIYVHLSGRDLDKAIDSIYGIAEKKEPDVVKPKCCPRCGKLNEPTAKYCSQCALILDVGERIRLEMEMAKSEQELLAMVAQNPDVAKMAMKFITLALARSDPDVMKELLEISKVENSKS